MRWNNDTQTAQILFGLGMSTCRLKGRRKDGREGGRGGNQTESGRAREGEVEGGRERKEGEGKASMLGSKWEEEGAMHLDACLRFRNHCAERVDCQAGLGQRVSSSTLLAHIHILPERP